MNIRFRCVLVIALTLGVVGSVNAQQEQNPAKADDFSQKLDLNILNKPTLGESGSSQLSTSEPSQLEVSLDPQAGLKSADVVTLNVKVTLGPGWYTYSQTTGFGGPTNIELSESQGVIPLGEGFVPDREPKVVVDPDLGEMEKYFNEVTWSRKYRVQPGVSKLSFAGTVDYQACNEQCIPYSETFEVSADVEAAPATQALASYSIHGRPPVGDSSGPVELTLCLSPEDAQPGETVNMTVRMRLDDGWHVYAQSQEEGPGTGIPIQFDLQNFQGLVAIDEGGFRADRNPEVKETELTKTLTVEQHLFHDEVTWTRTFEVAENAAETGFGIQGEFQYQICTDQKCLPPERFPFALGELSAARPIDELVTAAPVFDPNNIQLEEAKGGFGLYVVYAFLGGLILNIMPCVLPVLAIKILSFVKQAGESRARIFQLNVAYSVGVVAVFMALATLTVSLKMSFGGLFQLAEFKLVMACVIFAMGLSLLGVFEIPVPGLGGGGGREGLPGAFLTGIFATILATPCIGPFVGPALNWSVTQPIHVIYLLWGTMGVGMASPYLIAGLFPRVVDYLPKPGNWMVRFKELCGFAMMGAVIWILSFSTEFIMPTLIMMLGLGLGLWMIGNLYDSATHVKKKMTVRAVAVVAAGSIVYYGTTWMPQFDRPTTSVAQGNTNSDRPDAGSSNPDAPQPRAKVDNEHAAHGEHALPWQDFSKEAMYGALRQKKTVLIDFSADWCLTCKMNERNALNTEKTLQLVTERDVVTLYADFTDKSPRIKKWLEDFGGIGVPLTVILPANNPQQPLTLPGTFSESTLLEKLEEATRSQKKTAMSASSSAK